MFWNAERLKLLRWNDVIAHQVVFYEHRRRELEREAFESGAAGHAGFEFSTWLEERFRAEDIRRRLALITSHPSFGYLAETIAPVEDL